MKQASRALTTAAVGFLALDALLLGYAGVTWHRPALVVGGGVCAIGVVLVVVAWRRYRRTLAELDVAQREMRQEIESIRDLLQRRHFNN